MRNVSIAVGREASIDCHVSDADDYKVSFLNAMKVLERYRMPSLITPKYLTQMHLQNLQIYHDIEYDNIINFIWAISTL